jgi:hypothetical protein
VLSKTEPEEDYRQRLLFARSRIPLPCDRKPHEHVRVNPIQGPDQIGVEISFKDVGVIALIKR